MGGWVEWLCGVRGFEWFDLFFEFFVKLIVENEFK